MLYKFIIKKTKSLNNKFIAVIIYLTFYKGRKLSMKEEQSAHDHEHHHGKTPIILYFLGLILAVAGLFFQSKNIYLSNTLYSIASIVAGYQVILIHGISETIQKTKENKKFTPNSHILMGAAALGASLIGSFGEGTLLILIFSGSHFLEDYAEGRSKKEITKILEMNPTKARRIKKVEK